MNGTSYKTFEIPVDKIIVGDDRFRKVFDRKRLEELKSSIKSKGQIEPIIVTQGFELIAGERRLRACRELGRSVIAMFREDITDPLLRREIELEENLMREDLTPQEECIAKAEIHELMLKKHGGQRSGPSIGSGWGLGDTAEMLGQSKSAIAEDVKLGQLVPHLPQLREAKTKSEMKKVIKQLEKRAVWQQKAREASKSVDGTEIGPDPTSAKILEFSRNLVIGDMMEEWDKGEKPAGVVLFDPFWGVGLDEKRLGQGSDIAGDTFEDDPKKFHEMFPQWIAHIHERMSQDSHLYVFFGIIYHEFVYKTLESVGFQVNRRPIIWCKPGIKSTRVPEIWPGAGYEPIAFARKGKRDIVRKAADWFSITPLGQKDRSTNPAAKPPQVYEELLMRSAYPGDHIIDPMFGSGASLLACERLPELHLTWKGFDIDKNCKNVALVKLAEFVRGV